MENHTEEEIEVYLKEKFHGKSQEFQLLSFIGFLLTSLGLILTIVLYFTGIFDRDQNIVIALVSGIVLMGVVFLIIAYIQQSQHEALYSNNKNPRRQSYSTVLRESQVREATIDSIDEDYHSRVNGVARVTFYIDINGEKLRFSTFNPKLISTYRFEDSIPIYYHKEYPSILVPYDLVSYVNENGKLKFGGNQKKFDRAEEYRHIDIK